MRKHFRYFVTAPVLLFVSTGTLPAADAAGPLATAQKLFDAMSKHDAAAAKALFADGAQLFSARPDGQITATPFDKFADGIAASKDALLERIWNPKVMEEGSVAVVWAEYDFHRNGTFNHCGIDSFSLVKGKDGWKIVAVSDTRITTGCKPSPLGPPK